MRGLPNQVKESLEKARDSALLAVEIYNKPAIKFKSGGYIALMVIAWTSLFHAVFYRKKIKPYYRKDNGRYAKIEGDFKHWQLDECLKHYYEADTGNAVRKNLEFFIPLRNKIEHRSLPELDADIFGECQSLLLNFDNCLETEFGIKYCLRESLSFSLQLFPSSKNLIDAIKHNPGAKPIASFIQQYRSAISPDVKASSQYCFKAFLIQVANHKSEGALPIQFVNYDKLTNEQKTQINQFVAMVKYKDVPILNLDTLKPSEVVRLVQHGLGNPKIDRNGKQVNKFTLDTHTRCWKKHKIRPPKGHSKPQETNWQHCVYDQRHKDYGYTREWVDFLIKKLRDDKEFESLYKIITDIAA